MASTVVALSYSSPATSATRCLSKGGVCMLQAISCPSIELKSWGWNSRWQQQKSLHSLSTRCSAAPENNSSSDSDSSVNGDRIAEVSSKLRRPKDDFPPQEALLQAVSEISRLEGRTAKTTTTVMGGTASPYGSDWLELDKKVNTYPSFRGFTAIGTGGDDFVQAMVVAVESVMELRIEEWQIKLRESAQGRYVSVHIGPLRMESSDQVKAVYEAMRQDARMRYFL